MTPYQPDPTETRLRVADLTDAEIDSLRRQNPRLAAELHFPAPVYDNGVDPDAALLVAP